MSPILLWMAFVGAAIAWPAEMVTLKVVARDSHGPVALTRDDFAVFDREKPCKIEFFSIQTDASKLAGEAPKLPHNGFINGVARGPGAPAGITIILFDALNTSMEDAARVATRLKQLAKELGSDDRIAIYVLGGTLHVIRDFVGTAGVDAGNAIDDALEPVAAVHRVNDMRWTSDALEAIAHHVAPFPGRKNLVWVASRFPVDIVGDAAVDRALSALRDNNVSLYPVGPADFNGALVEDAEARLVELASRTGGQAFYTGDFRAALHEAIEDMRVTYTIGFYPDSKSLDGKYHPLAVKVPGREGIDLRFPRGYYAENPKQSPEESSAELGRAVRAPLEANDITIAARVDPHRDGKTTELNLTIVVSTRRLTFTGIAGRWKCDLDVVVAELDPGGLIVASKEGTAPIMVSKDVYDEYIRSGLPFKDTLELRPGVRQLRIAVMDRLSRAIGSLFIALDSLEPPVGKQE